MNLQDLVQKYSQLFESEEIRNDETKSCMAWGVECGNGWYDILDDMMSKIASLNPPKGFFFTQIKEKFGTLRVYTSFSNDQIDKIIREAEMKSAVTCEVCGKEGTVRQGSWVKTRCDDCVEKRRR